MSRDYQKLKALEDFRVLDAPQLLPCPPPPLPPTEEQMILRMLVRPKYGPFHIPPSLAWLEDTIRDMAALDHSLTGIGHSWCYVTVRHGPVTTKTDDEWHFDGASFRTTLIPERNYVWVDHTPFQYKLGAVEFPHDFDPNKHNLFTYADQVTKDSPIFTTWARSWYLINPFCLHRRDPNTPKDRPRTFIRISFPDIEGRDVNNTHNPLLPTPAWGRDPVRDFRNQLKDYDA